MGNVPILKSKLTVPSLPASFLMTERLAGLHREMDSHCAISVCAPAGYGKTTLVVSYLKSRLAAPAKTCWCRLDPEDSDPSTFVTHLAEAVFPADASEQAESRRAVLDSVAAREEPRRAVAMVCQEMWGQHGRPGSPKTYIVLDDFQNVAGAGDICNLTRFMLDNLPPQCTVIVLSRSDPAVFTEKQILEKGVLELSASDLTFSRAEVRDFVLSTGQSDPEGKLTDFVVRASEGWIAGMAIICQAAKSRGRGSMPAAPAEFGGLGHEDMLFRYMSMEVLRFIDADSRDALAKLALLQDFTAADARAILGIDDVQRVMDRCRAFGLFIQRTATNPTVYRFHSLFREFLLHVLRESCPVQQVADIHLRAAVYYAEHGPHLRVAAHLMHCGDTARALELVTTVGMRTWMFGEGGQFAAWLDTLPDTAIESNPILLTYKAMTMPQLRHAEAERLLAMACRVAQAKGDIMLHFWSATALFYFLALNNDMAGILNVVPDAQRREDESSAGFEVIFQIFAALRSVAKSDLSLAREQLAGIPYAALPEQAQFLCLCYSWATSQCLGRLDEAERFMETALTVDYVNSVDSLRAQAKHCLATVLMLKNDKGRLVPLIAETIATAEKSGLEYLLAYGKHVAAFERYWSLDIGAAVGLLDYAVFHFRRLDNGPMAAATNLLRRIWALQSPAAGSAGPDLAAAREEMDVVSRAPVGMLTHERSLSVFGALAREAGDFATAELCLREAIESADAKKASQVLGGACLHMAKLNYDRGDTEGGHRFLKWGMRLAEQGRYFTFWDIHIPTLVEMALRSLRSGLSAGFAEELLGRYYRGGTVKYLIEKAVSMKENRIAAFTRDFIAGYRPDQPEQLYLVKASLFGASEVWVNGTRIPDTEWKTRKVKGLLEFLLLSSGRTVPRERLTDTLWPGADTKSASASMWTALYQLRKTLSKYGVEVTGAGSFIQETLAGLQIRSGDMLELDVREYEQLHFELRGAAKEAGDGTGKGRRIDALLRMVSLYTGDLMTGNEYGDLVFLERQRYRSMFLEACLALSSVYLGERQVGQAEETLRRALAVDPLNERVCLELLRLLVAQGRRSGAVELYRKFTQRLKDDLDVDVDDRLTEAVKTPRQKGGGPDRHR